MHCARHRRADRNVRRTLRWAIKMQEQMRPKGGQRAATDGTTGSDTAIVSKRTSVIQYLAVRLGWHSEPIKDCIQWRMSHETPIPHFDRTDQPL